MRKHLLLFSIFLALSLMVSSFGFAQRVALTPAPKKEMGVLKANKSDVTTPFNQVKDDEGEWIHWDDGANANGIGTGGAAEFAVGSRWLPADLQDYDGMYITQISFFPRVEAATYALRIWAGENHTQQYAQDVEEFTVMEWNTVELETPYQIDASDEMMFGVFINTTTGHPAGCDAGPALVWKGDVMYYNDAWISMMESFALNYNWNLQAYVEEIIPVTYSVTFNVDMTAVEGFDPEQHTVFLAGTITDPVWIEPGNEGSIVMELVSDSKDAPYTWAESWEEYDDFTTNLAPWVTHLINDDDTWGSGDFDFPGEGEAFAFMVFNPSETDPDISGNHPAYDGSKYLIAVQSQTINDNKWLISPATSINETSEFSFAAKSITAAYGLERFRVLVSTTGTATDDFTQISAGDYIEAPTDWQPYTFDLSDYAGEVVHIAIQYVSYDAFIFMLDDFKVTSDYEPPTELIYTATLQLEAGNYEYKYFSDAFGAGWAGGEWDEDYNRSIEVTDGDMVIDNVWGVLPGSSEAFILTFGFDEGEDYVQINDGYIIVWLAAGTDVTALTPTMTISEGATVDYIYPTVIDFTENNSFTVTAQNGVTTNTYYVYLRHGDDIYVEPYSLSNLILYPNPFSSSITLNNASGVSRLIVTNIIGQRVMDMQLPGSERITIPTDGLTKGVYLMVFEAGNGERMVKKMIKE